MAPPLVRRLYPRASDPRPPLHHPSTRAHRRQFFRAALLNFCLLLLLFLCLYSYLLGALYGEETRVHNLQVLWVDYDGGVVGAAVREAYGRLRGDQFPTLIERTAVEFAAAEDLMAAVCRTEYWAALFVHGGASARLADALAGGGATYDAANVISYIWNEARYPTVVDAAIASNLATLTQTARLAYVARNGSAVFAGIPPANADAIAAFANPWTLTARNIQPVTQGAHVVYNTLAIVLMIIQDFFFLGTINGLYEQFQIYTRVAPHRILLFRFGVSAGFAMLATMLASGAIWAFKASWTATATQWALTWLVLWLFAHQNFLTLDVFTIWLPPPYVSMALISWVVINVTSIIYPFELSANFYRWSYALPAHAAYDALMDVWSHGCNPHLDYAFPVLFAYELSSATLSALGTYRRCHYAMLKKQQADEREKAAGEDDARKLSGDANSESPKTAAPQTGANDGEDGFVTARNARKHRAESNRLAEPSPCFQLIGNKESE